MACNISQYYAAAAWSSLSNISSSNLLSLVQERVSSPHTALPYTSTATDVWDALTFLDADPTNSSYIIEIYSEKSVLASNNVDSNGWNREHVFPKSYGVGYSGSDYTDVHSLRAASWKVNSARGNKPFGECSPITDSTCSSPAHSLAANDTAANPSLFMPPASVRGDVARSLFYMAARYDGSDDNTEDLILSSCPESLAFAMGNLTILRQWHIDDPVDERELWRTEAVCKHFQGNRNPFIDFPELVEMVWGNYSDYVCHTDYEEVVPSPVPTIPPTISPTTEAELLLEPCLLLTGILDGDTTGGLPKAIELYVKCDSGINSLEEYGIGSANNGGGSDGEEFTLPSSTDATNWKFGQSLYIAYESSSYPNSFESFFGFAPNFTSSALYINGDDAIELFWRGNVIDTYGNISKISDSWEYTDGWAYRNSTYGGSSSLSTWNVDEWQVNPNYLSSFSTNNAAGQYKFPIHTFSLSSPTPLPTSSSSSNASTPLPTPEPSFHPTPEPSFHPTPEPSFHPTPEPSFHPTPEPSFHPTPEPSFHPTPEPSFHPTPEPSFHPTPEPSFHPTFTPSLLPSKTSTPSLVPSLAPTIIPTTIDTVIVIVSFEATSSSKPTSSDEINIKTTVATALNVSENSIRNYLFTFVNATVRRRLEEDEEEKEEKVFITPHRRSLLVSSYLWTVQFDVVVALSSTSSTDSESYTLFVSSMLTSTSFTSTVLNQTGGGIDLNTVSSYTSTEIPTPSPSLLPISLSPSIIPTISSDKNSKSSSMAINLGSLTYGIGLILLAIFSFMFLSCCVLFVRKSGICINSDSVNPNNPKQILTSKKSVELTSFDGYYPDSPDKGNPSPSSISSSSALPPKARTFSKESDLRVSETKPRVFGAISSLAAASSSSLKSTKSVPYSTSSSFSKHLSKMPTTKVTVTQSLSTSNDCSEV